MGKVKPKVAINIIKQYGEKYIVLSELYKTAIKTQNYKIIMKRIIKLIKLDKDARKNTGLSAKKCMTYTLYDPFVKN